MHTSSQQSSASVSVRVCYSFPGPQCNTDRVLIWLNKKYRVTTPLHLVSWRRSSAVRVDERCPSTLPSKRLLVYHAFDPVFRWLMSAVLPPEPHQPGFLERCACTYADDFALATASLRVSLHYCAFVPQPQKVPLDSIWRQCFRKGSAPIS